MLILILFLLNKNIIVDNNLDNFFCDKCDRKFLS